MSHSLMREETPVHDEAEIKLAFLRESVENENFTSVFQPLIDLRTASVIGYEVLSRGPAGLTSPDELLTLARQADLLWQLDQAFRRTAIRGIAALPPVFSSYLFFINVSPDALDDPGFITGFTLSTLADYAIDQSRIVLEITERGAGTKDIDGFQNLIRHYANQGFKLALDDFGAGDSGLIKLVGCAPHYIKLDMAIARDVHLHPYKQRLVRSLVSFASSVQAKLVVEGIEKFEELETLIRLGVFYGQGYLFARPAAQPPVPSPEVCARTKKLTARYTFGECDPSETIAGLAEPCATAREGTMTVADLNYLFFTNQKLSQLVVVRDRFPLAEITRQRFHSLTSGPVGYSLVERRPMEVLANHNPLIVEERTMITMLAKLAMDRPRENLYDPVIVVDGQGRLVGTVSIQQLIKRAAELDVQYAQGANPLTALPGNRAIESWLHECLRGDEYMVVYIDLDRFKEFNDCYGFLLGDEMIRVTANFLKSAVEDFKGVARLGHVGGDDFVIVSHEIFRPETFGRMCEEFDRVRRDLFSEADRKRGFFEAVDRRGEKVTVPLVTASFSVITSECMGANRPHPAQLSQIAASLKKKVKQMTAQTQTSGFLFERRHYDEGDRLPQCGV